MEVVAPDLRESHLRIEGDRPSVALPDSEPQVATAQLPRSFMNCGHELPGDTRAVRRPIEIEALQFDRSVLRHASGHGMTPHLCVTDQRSAAIGEQRDDVRIGELRRLLRYSVGAG